ncbi:nitrite reductase large subunit NirB [Paenibacillus harenae]|uniref:Nitrite reductase (NADH) large subunit n=1 Tax=Paenibacillus harenae TaxID=306543 RepID=A0ABT9TXS1_PAEHA|nr:nitrite reductase large subunit NirB [Paenibacillus harenae]MDQ0111265.1 nitrite reductase (NADH) large subunit [Paenibacillus harenae]
MSRKQLVVIGNGMAGIKCVEEILNINAEQFQITVIGSEKHPNYNRILLSKVLQGDSSIKDIVINDWSWYTERGIKLYTGETATRIHHGASKSVETASGLRIPYDVLIIATGSSAFIPPIIGVNKPGVISFRNIDDCQTMMDYAGKYRKAAVIGGGLLGLEAARGLLNLGMEAEVIHNAPYLMNRQLDRASAEMLQKELEGQGMRFWLGKDTDKIIGRDRAKGVRFTTGYTVEADLVVLSVGIRPNTELAKRSGIDTNRAILVDDYMRTDIENIYAVGECAEHRGIAYGLVAPLYEQGKVLARTICGETTPPYEGSIPYAQLKVSGVQVFSVGDIQEDKADTAIQQFDGIRNTYKKVTMQYGRVCGAILYGDTDEATTLLNLVKQKAPVASLKASSGQAQDGSSPIDAEAENMAPRETVCACNAVTKSAIMCAVLDDGCQTADQVRDKTKASSSCGGCRPMLGAVVRFALRSGKEGAATAEPAICSCTSVGHQALKAAIQSNPSMNAHSLKLTLNWGKMDGCRICNSAIHYYMELSIPQQHGDHESSASAALAGRSNRLTVTAASSAAVSEGEGYNSAWLSETLRSMWPSASMPKPVKAAVSSGVKTPIGVLVHDIGLTGSPSGWELYAGGHMELPVKQGQLLGIAESDIEALELSVACLQLYRERAYYGEPLWKWLERDGMVEVREMLLDLDIRRELFDRANRPNLQLEATERRGEANAAVSH